MNMKQILVWIAMMLLSTVNELHYEAIIAAITLEGFVVMIAFEVVLFVCIILSPSEEEDC